MDVCLNDNVKARKLDNKGQYNKINKKGKAIDAQAILMKEAIEESKKPVINDDKPLMRLIKKFRRKSN